MKSNLQMLEVIHEWHDYFDKLQQQSASDYFRSGSREELLVHKELYGKMLLIEEILKELESDE